MVKFDRGTLPEPAPWNGPPKLSLIGPLKVFDPAGSTVTPKFRSPLVILWEPVNVCLSREAASVLDEEPLLPHAPSVTEASATKSTAATTRGARNRWCIETFSSARRPNGFECSIGFVRRR